MFPFRSHMRVMSCLGVHVLLLLLLLCPHDGCLHVCGVTRRSYVLQNTFKYSIRFKSDGSDYSFTCTVCGNDEP